MIRIDDVPEYARYKALHASTERGADEEAEMYALRQQLHEAGFMTGHLGVPKVNPDRAETYYVWDSRGGEDFEDGRTYTACSHEHAVDLEADSWYADYADGNVMTVAVLPESALDEIEEPEWIHSYEDEEEGEQVWATYQKEVTALARQITYRSSIPAPNVSIFEPLAEEGAS